MIMKQTKKFYSLILGLALVSSGLLISLNSDSQTAHAQTCNAGGSAGNLLGYATMTNLPSVDNANRIYMSTESWNLEEATTTSEPFAVSYNRNVVLDSDTWAGKGWNKIIGWVDFGEDHLQNIAAETATFEGVRLGGAAWGYWNPVIKLSDVNYTTDPGGFIGFGTNGDFTSDAGIDDDDYVGAGLIDFSNVQLVEFPCDEYVNITLNNTNRIIQTECPINNPVVRWTTENIVSGSCKTAGGLWQTAGSRDDNNTLGDETANNVTTENLMQIIRLRCTGSDSGLDVYGQATAICGAVPSCDPATDPTCTAGDNEISDFEFKEV
jgi:hypothetical protein